jgi:hypothetical protein
MKRKKQSASELREEFIIGCNELIKCKKDFTEKNLTLAIDPSRNSTGITISDGSVTKSRAYKSKLINGFSKVMFMEKSLLSAIKNRKPFVIIEGYSYNSRYGREAAGELGGVLRRILYKKQLPLMTVSPLTVKAWIGAKRKSQIMLEILSKYGVKINDEDAADSFVMCDILNKSIFLAEEFLSRKITHELSVRDYFKFEAYKDDPRLNLTKKRIDSLFRTIATKGKFCDFFVPKKKEEDLEL